MIFEKNLSREGEKEIFFRQLAKGKKEVCRGKGMIIIIIIIISSPEVRIRVSAWYDTKSGVRASS